MREEKVMLTARQNLLETIRGGKPDRFVKQFEFMRLLDTPFVLYDKRPGRGEPDATDAWGVTFSFPEGAPCPIPVHSPEKVVIKDIVRWRNYVHAPNVKWADEEWEPFIAAAEAVDRRAYFAAAAVGPGFFELCCQLGEPRQTLANLAEDPDDMHDLIRYLTDHELRLADEICSHLRPDALFLYDDWGGLAPEVFDEFFLEPYREIYGYYRSHGVELVVHGSGSAAGMVPKLIGIGVDILQGVSPADNIPGLIGRYGEQLSFMGGIDLGPADGSDPTPELSADAVRRACAENGKLFYIPCVAGECPDQLPTGIREAVDGEIERMSEELF